MYTKRSSNSLTIVIVLLSTTNLFNSHKYSRFKIQTYAALSSVFNGFSAVCVYKYQCAVSSEDDENKGEETFGGNGPLWKRSMLVFTQQSPTRMRAVFSIQHAPVSNTHQYISLQCSIYTTTQSQLYRSIN